MSEYNLPPASVAELQVPYYEQKSQGLDGAMIDTRSSAFAASAFGCAAILARRSLGISCQNSDSSGVRSASDNEFLNGLGKTLLFIGRRDGICPPFDVFRSISHRYAEAGTFEHGKVVRLIAYRRDLVRRNAKRSTKILNDETLVSVAMGDVEIIRLRARCGSPISQSPLHRCLATLHQF